MSAQVLEKKCPICNRPADVNFYPFCSRRCADIDLGNWFGGDYAIPTDEDLGNQEENNF
ncbi:MAG: DNA gyrase inhibitor YacG [Proteobacteria bacterium]|nr:DNA gyrase inhibitor YacG [Pseudomonadota bacterium]